MIENLPLTNKDKWRNERLYPSFPPSTKFQYFVRLAGGNSTHVLFDRGQEEGIRIKWKTNTFKGLMKEHAYHLLHDE